MIDAIVFIVTGLFVAFFGLLALAGVLILLVVFVGIPLAFIVRLFMPNPPD